MAGMKGSSPVQVLSPATGVRFLRNSIWEAQNPAGTTYNAWRASGACPTTAPNTTPPAGFTQLNSTPITSTTYFDTAVTAGDTYCYVVTAVGANGQSVPSNTAGVGVPAAFPVSGVTAVAR